MAFAGAAAQTCAVSINVFDGRRQPFPAGANVLFTLIDGDQKQVYRNFQQASSVRIGGLPYHANYADKYTALASADGYEQAGFTPVKAAPSATRQVDLMLLPKKGTFNFSSASWDILQARRPGLARVLTAGASTTEAARDRYMELMERGPVLACLLNIATAMEQLHLPAGTPLDYVRQLVWDETMGPDRFYAWADAQLLEQTREAARQGLLAPEPGSSVFHPGATASFKQVEFGEANLQLTFHEEDRREIDGVDCLKLEPDIDYYRDLGSHALLEVLRNSVTGSLTDPRQVYVLRWIAGRRAGRPEFDPLYTIV